MLLENDLRKVVRVLIKEFWKPSANMVTLGDPHSSDFFQSQSRALYGYSIGDKELLVNLDYYIDLISEKDADVAKKIGGLRYEIENKNKLKADIIEKESSISKETKELLTYLMYFLSDNEYDANRIKKDYAFFQNNLNKNNVDKIKSFLENDIITKLEEIKQKISSYEGKIDEIKKHKKNKASNLSKIFLLIDKIK